MLEENIGKYIKGDLLRIGIASLINTIILIVCVFTLS
jgi:hypothetical protein